MAAARYQGVSLQDIEQEFRLDRRSAQRMTQALEAQFPSVETRTDEERRKYWRLPSDTLKLVHAQSVRDSELYGLDWSIERARTEGDARVASALASLRDRLLSMMPRPHARRVEADAEALLEARGYASRPGPRVQDEPALLDLITEALRAPFRLAFQYRSSGAAEPTERLVEPHGLLLGIRRYLIARPVNGDGTFRQYRLDRIANARIDGHGFARDPSFDLASFAARAFGSYHAEHEYGEVVWQFRADIADVARSFVFHPAQVLTDEPDGSLTVRFNASGWLEMAWYLYQWGDRVEVLAPDDLRRLVANHRRSDFPAPP